MPTYTLAYDGLCLFDILISEGFSISNFAETTIYLSNFIKVMEQNYRQVSFLFIAAPIDEFVLRLIFQLFNLSTLSRPHLSCMPCAS